MKVALAQMEVVPGRPKKNLETMLKMIDEAKAKKADLVVFPEMCVGGYLVGDKWTDETWCANLMAFNEEIRKASEGIAVAYGNVYVEPSRPAGSTQFHPNKDGRSRKYNAVYVFQDGKPAQRAVRDGRGLLPQGVQPKTLLPTYRIFDDERFFFSMQDVAKDAHVPLETLMQPFLIEVAGKKVPIGFELCEDLWCEDYRLNGAALNPTKMLIANGAERIMNISASPWTVGKNAARDHRVEFLKRDSGGSFVPFYYVNCVGVQNNGKNIVTFDGGSTVYDADGRPVVLDEDAYRGRLIMVDDTALSGPALARTERPRIAQKYDAIITALRHLKDMSGAANDPKFVIGMSGGVDSSVVAALLAQALGPDRVLGINMPTKYNSQKTKDAAQHVAQKLGIGYESIPIEGIVDSIQQAIDGCDADGTGRKLSEFNLENVQAKVRGTDVLSNIAAKYGGMFSNNGNKLEVFLGYATLYGDWGGAVGVIGDLLKTEVFEMARYINDEVYHEDIIPRELFPDSLFRFGKDQIAPSAELKSKQIDPMKFGYHDALLAKVTDYKKTSPENLLQWYLDGTMERNLNIPTALIERWGVDDPKTFVEDLEWFFRMGESAVYKRIQSPPIIITSKSAYGFDIRESMLPQETSLAYDALKTQVLKMKRYESAVSAQAPEA